LNIHGGVSEKIEISTLHLKTVKDLILRDMPSVGLENVWAEIGELKSLQISNVEDFTVDAFNLVF
jgi:hypothetical protein